MQGQGRVFIAVFLGCLGTIACVPDGRRAEQRIRQAGELVVLTRVAPTTYYEDEKEVNGFEFALTQELARGLDVTARYRVFDSVGEMLQALQHGEGDLIAAGLTHRTETDESFLPGPDYLVVHQEVVCRRHDRIPRKLSDLADRSILLVAGGNAERRLQTLKQDQPQLRWFVSSDLSDEQVFEKVWDGTVDCTIADSNVVAMLQPHYPELLVAFRLDGEQRLAWLVHPEDHDLQAFLNRWFPEREQDRRLPSLRDRHLSGNSFDYVDIKVFLARIETRLPKYRGLFVEAAEDQGLDWRLLAAQAYQESHWSIGARSPTGVRGIMMLTRPTAAEMGVSSRLDPGQSIQGGSGYLAKILNRIPDEVEPQDRMWFALAAYNVGLGHIEDARLLTRKSRRDPNKWSDVQGFLPLLAEKEHYENLRYGYARGAEPVHYVKQIRSYQSILEKRFRE